MIALDERPALELPTRGVVLRALVIAGEHHYPELLPFAVRREMMRPGWHEHLPQRQQERLTRAVEVWMATLTPAMHTAFVEAIAAHLEALVGLGVLRKEPAYLVGGRLVARFSSEP